jgi:hypothetical protein
MGRRATDRAPTGWWWSCRSRSAVSRPRSGPGSFAAHVGSAGPGAACGSGAFGTLGTKADGRRPENEERTASGDRSGPLSDHLPE